MKNIPNYSCSKSNSLDLGETLKVLVSATRITVENSAEYALSLIREGNYEDALVFLKNAIEGIEILTA